jgi:hypothetical protein
MRIHDVPKLTEDDAWSRVRATLARHPRLQPVYDDATLAELIRRRASTTNYLLYWLVLDPDDQFGLPFWTEVVDDLAVLEPFGAFETFRDKMRFEEKDRLTSWRTELWFAAWLVRNGVSIALEPDVGGKHPEFVTNTIPRTWWEIKSPLELDAQRTESAIYADVQRRLRSIPEPYYLHIMSAKIALADVPQAVRAIRAEIRTHFQAKGALPAKFESDGLAIAAMAETQKRPTGFLGSMATAHLFGEEHSEQLADKIASAVPQLPEGEAGIVVIDRTLSDWNDEIDAINACFGAESFAFINNEVVQVRGERRLFRPGAGTRISAVVSYSRHPMHREKGGYELLVIHNPYAQVPLPEDQFNFPGTRHMRCRFEPDGKSYRLETTIGGAT